MPLKNKSRFVADPVNKEIKDMMKFRDILLKKFVQTRDGMDWRDAESNYTFHALDEKMDLLEFAN